MPIFDQLRDALLADDCRLGRHACHNEDRLRQANEEIDLAAEAAKRC